MKSSCRLRKGTSGLIDFLRPVTPTTEPSPEGTLPAGSPPLGETTLRENQYYVNGAVTSCVLYGVDVLAPRIWGGPPDLVLSGPNEGNSVGILTSHSGTVSATVTTINKGIPAMALSANWGEENPQLVAEIAVKVVESAYGSIQEGKALNIIFPATTANTTVDDYSIPLQ